MSTNWEIGILPATAAPTNASSESCSSLFSTCSTWSTVIAKLESRCTGTFPKTKSRCRSQFLFNASQHDFLSNDLSCSAEFWSSFRLVRPHLAVCRSTLPTRQYWKSCLAHLVQREQFYKLATPSVKGCRWKFLLDYKSVNITSFFQQICLPEPLG